MKTMTTEPSTARNEAMVEPSLGGMSRKACPSCGAICWKYSFNCFASDCGAAFPVVCDYHEGVPAQVYLVWPLENGKMTNPLNVRLCVDCRVDKSGKDFVL